jgi:hypothetical protein
VTEEFVIQTSNSYDVTAKQQFNDVVIALTLARGTVLYDRKAKQIIVIREKALRAFENGSGIVNDAAPFAVFT